MVRVDADDFERSGLEVGTLKRLHVISMRHAAPEHFVRADLDQHRGNFQQRVPGAVESAGFDVDDHRQEAAEARGHQHG